ncbi:hypothetical protein R1flu_018977 [Riccia fluitans]|uniref:Uncharacterized protein n=1 Tax=Riccia fluitans TaxID=41844 RepID=A0ABD1ZHD7_9MARC
MKRNGKKKKIGFWSLPVPNGRMLGILELLSVQMLDNLRIDEWDDIIFPDYFKRVTNVVSRKGICQESICNVVRDGLRADSANRILSHVGFTAVCKAVRLPSSKCSNKRTVFPLTFNAHASKIVEECNGYT